MILLSRIKDKLIQDNSNGIAINIKVNIIKLSCFLIEV